MSWTMSVPEPIRFGEYAAIETAGTPQQGYAEPESAAALQAVRDAVISLVDSGVLGGGPFLISASGHSNPNGVARDGWATDLITINISSQAKVTDGEA